MQKAKVGLIVDKKLQPWNIHDLINLSFDSDIYEISCIIVQELSPKKNSSSVKKNLESFLFKIICYFESFYVKRFPEYKKYYKKYNIDPLDIPKISVNPLVSKSGLIYKYSKYDLNQIKDQDLDILIRGGSGILKGEILNICKKGIISFHHGNNEVNRGSPPAFWEVMNRHKSTGFIIQILKEELDAGDVIFKGSIPTSFLYSLNVVRLYMKANIFMHKTLEDIFSGKKINIFQKKPYDKKLFKLPSLKTQIKYAVKTIFYFLIKISRRLANKRNEWGVAYQFAIDWKDTVLWKSKKIPNPKGRFLADPFLISHKGSNFCFVEDYDFKLNRGLISVIEMSRDKISDPEIVLSEDFHLSYPYIFEYNGEKYMCPETHQAKEIRLYKSSEFPRKWELVKVLMSGVSAVDSNIFRLHGKWWMLTNIDTSNTGEHCSELHLFFSKDLLDDIWHPHPLNPIIFNSEIARNGGFIIENDNLYRVYQKQGWDNYGEGLGVSRIVKINEFEYQEDSMFEISPSFFDNIKGTHTYNYKNGLAVIDFSSIT
tara:strand:+ start:1733 stop:3355 length:1623 start_codon:yes stop_codon:yes gene_type:complete